MTEDVPGRRDDGVMTLPQLVRARMAERGWSYSDLERRSGHALSRGRWQQLGSGVTQKKFPDPASLTVMAAVLELDITTIVLAAAHTVGLDVHHEHGALAHLLPPGTEHLSHRTRDAILSLIRAAVADSTNGAVSAERADGTGTRLEWPKRNAPSQQRGKGVNNGGEQ